MDVLWIGIAAVIVIAGLWWWWRRRASAPVEETPDSRAEAGAQSFDPPPPQVLDREALVNRSRVLDPSKWDNSPEAGVAEVPETEELPRFFSREDLKGQTGDGPGATDQARPAPPAG